MARRIFCALLIWGIVITVTCSAISAANKKITEYQLKTVYIYKFIPFVQWPQFAGAAAGKAQSTRNNFNGKNNSDGSDPNRLPPFVIGIVGNDPFGNYFKSVEGKIIKANNRKLKVVRFGPYQEKHDYQQCQILFINLSKKNQVIEIIEETKNRPMLTISDQQDFLKYGGMINFVLSKNKICWEINQTPVTKSGLKVSTQLLRSAAKVVQIPKLPKGKNEN